MKFTRVIPKSLALFYLMNEFSQDDLEVTTMLTEDGCWANEVIIRGVKKSSFTDIAEMMKVYYEHAQADVDREQRAKEKELC